MAIAVQVIIQGRVDKKELGGGGRGGREGEGWQGQGEGRGGGKGGQEGRGQREGGDGEWERKEQEERVFHRWI